LVHDNVFTPGRRLFEVGRAVYSSSSDPQQGPLLLRVVEKVSKSALFGCRDCGDCSLPEIAFLCPESQCAKNQRNGPCGGTRDGKCEVDDFDCIWSRAYDRLKREGNEQHLLDHAPVIQDESLRGTSSWANALLERDHHSTPTGDCASIVHNNLLRDPATPDDELVSGGTPDTTSVTNNEDATLPAQSTV
jgi:methylenetetrahydrofolate reductase (NADPH)